MSGKELGSSERHHRYMARALEMAQRAESEGEVPVGCVVVRDDAVIGEGWNQTIGQNDPSAHAEIMALRAAGQYRSNYRLVDCEVYVTLEPCAMCAGAIVHARIQRLIYGATDPKTGACGSVFSLLPGDRHNHHVEVFGGIEEARCAEQLRQFFRDRRRRG